MKAQGTNNKKLNYKILAEGLPIRVILQETKQVLDLFENAVNYLFASPWYAGDAWELHCT